MLVGPNLRIKNPSVEVAAARPAPGTEHRGAGERTTEQAALASSVLGSTMQDPEVVDDDQVPCLDSEPILQAFALEDAGQQIVAFGTDGQAVVGAHEVE